MNDPVKREIENVLEIINETRRYIRYCIAIKKLQERLPDPEKLLEKLNQRHEKILIQRMIIDSNSESIN